MGLRERLSPAAGTAIFLVAAPGTFSGLLPWLLSGYRMGPPFLGIEAVRWLGVALLVLGGVLVLETFARFALQGRGTPAPIYPTETLVVTGSYRFVRNPMYVGVLSLVFGQALLFGSVAVLIYGLVAWLTVHAFVMAYEEPTLQRTFGEQYSRYRSHVRRWIPRLTPWRG
jgi:protein-S-isoprenylcysteine O-methyltransferase Ste14